MEQSLQNYAHATTAQLSWHVQKFVAMRLQRPELQKNLKQIRIESENVIFSEMIMILIHGQV